MAYKNGNSFGSPLIGRSYEADTSNGYRFGMNTQEKDDEIYGKGNASSAEFWEYDTRLDRRWNLDPKPISSISQYACFNNSPIWLNDPFGDKFRIGGDKQQSKDDVNSIAKSKNQKYIKTDESGIVTLDFGNSSQKKINKILKKDEGLALVKDLVEAKENYLYEASDIILLNNENGDKMTDVMYRDNTQIVNASNGGKDSRGGHTERPRDGYDGQVIIHPGAQWEEETVSGSPINKSRASIVFHELAENFERTHNCVDYSGNNGAHNLAIYRENKWHGHSYSPGMYTKIIPAAEPTKARSNEIIQIFENYNKDIFWGY
jgi:hypothetical protein